MRLSSLLPILTMLAACAGNQTGTSITIGAAGSANAAPAASSAASTAPVPVTPPVPAKMIAAGSTSAAPPATTTHTAKRTPVPAATPALAPPVVATPAGSIAFTTRHASYETARIENLPGWRNDAMDGGAWDAFRRSCGVLHTHAGWSEPCAASLHVDAHNPAAIRAFFETWFNAYRIRNTDQSADGTLTGYYEPQLNGAAQAGGAYVYPVYGTPEDMLYLDARRLPADAHGTVLHARVSGHTVVPLGAGAAVTGNGIYTLDLHDVAPDIRDKLYRVRIDHDRIVPYYTRTEIENGELKAPVLAYVDDPVMLYSMQVQGSGKIRLRDGSIRRVAYAEQNGYPFIPPVAHAAGAAGTEHKIAVRGIDMDIDVSDDTASNTAPGDAGNGDSQGGGDDEQPVSPLLRGFALEGEALAPAAAAKSAVPSRAKGHHAGTLSAPVHHFATSDPSYVFFRVIPDSPNGPTGALGVPLAAGRSVAIDPRTTPLGAPVFVAAGSDTPGGGSINRLMMAQDTGGAIRGPVRADYFFGDGQQAQMQASHTKTSLQMWVLLPKGLHVGGEGLGPKTRGGGAAESNADCLVADPVLCVDDGQ